MLNNLKVLLVENHTILRQGLKRLLEDEEIDVVGEAEDGRTGIELTDELNPDLVVMDISLPKLGGIEATRQITKYHPDIKVLMLTIHSDESYVYKALEAGAKGYILKETASDVLIEAIEKVMHGNIFLSPSLPGDLLDNYNKMVKSGKKIDEFRRLTNREMEILQLIAEGYTSKEIAENLYISVKTVENHRANIKTRIDIHDTAGLVRYAIKIGLIESDIQKK
ncbi:MAG: response regulator transcription factor [Candidatus Krumholzibacteriota bacterium]|nr:response regulator transcription factor [Candidatus Krumholzibacteriota bacterium]